jgi:hypothetical protein
MKFGRTYTLEIQTNPLSLDQLISFGIAGGSYTGNAPSTPARQIITITDPLTINFTVTTNILSSAHQADIRIINLGKTLRELIYKDDIDQKNDRFYRSIRFSAGYGNKQSLIFQGNIQFAYSERQGTEWYTTIHAYDGGFGMKYGNSNRSYASGTPITTVIKDLAKDMPSIKLKYLSPITDTVSKSVYSGNSWDYIQDIWTSDYGYAYIDREEIFLTKQDEVIQGGIVNISSESGLLETPKKFDTQIEVKLLFEPTLRIGQLINLISEVTECNGKCKIVGMNHSGIISDAIAGEAITTLNLWNNKGKPFPVTILS